MHRLFVLYLILLHLFVLCVVFFFFFFFFFQAEDGIRDRNVTGVQTCALPIFRLGTSRSSVTRYRYLKFYTFSIYFGRSTLPKTTNVIRGWFYFVRLYWF